MEVFKVYALNRIQQQRTWSRSLIFLHVAVFKVSPQARDQVVDIPVMAQTQIPMVVFPIEIPQLQYIDQVVDVCCAGPADSCEVVGDGRDPTVAARFLLDSCCMPVVCNDKCRWSMTLRSSSTAMDVLVTIHRQLRQWKCPIFSSSTESWTDQLCNRTWYSTFSNGGLCGDEWGF